MNPQLRLEQASEPRSLSSAPTMLVRPAREADIQAICDLVNGFADQNLMLHRTPAQIRHALGDFLVVVEREQVVGCGYLAQLSADLAEIRSLAVAPEQHGKGVGAALVQALEAMARTRGLSQICALTLVPDFFAKHGFQRVERWAISPKIWGECVYCPKFHACDEIAVLKSLDNGD